MKISILGCGVFGSALRTHFLRNGHIVYSEKIEDSEVVFVAVPSYVVGSVLSKFKDEIKSQKIIICSKGFDESGNLLSEVLKIKFPNNEILFLYGPSLADEIERGDFSAMVLAGEGDSKIELKKQIESNSFFVELSDDIIGVQVGSAMKNIITIFVGIMEGAKYGQNARAFVFTKGVQEIQKFGVALGSNPNTFLGLTCVGDLTLQSRNRDLGIALGQGRKVSEFKPELGSPQEGIATLKTARIIAKEKGIEVPFMNTLYSIIFEELEINKAIRML